MATFKSSGTDKDVKVQPTGTGAVKVGTGAAAAVVSSEGDQDLTLQTGNATTGTITITDGANGDISISPNGTGSVVVNTDLDVDNLNINGNTISSTDTNGDINLTPDGTGKVVTSKADINGGNIDGTTIGGTTPAAGSFTDMAFNSGYGSAATAYGCRAWVNFDGTFGTSPFTIANGGIRASGNVSSVTDNGGNGDYTVNFTNAMPDANYSVVGTASWDGTTLNNQHGMSLAPKNNNTGALSTGSVNVITYYEGNATRYDPLFASVSIFR